MSRSIRGRLAGDAGKTHRLGDREIGDKVGSSTLGIPVRHRLERPVIERAVPRSFRFGSFLSGSAAVVLAGDRGIG
ncbi:hypothetical protein [Sphingopyxis sp. Root1497]|uniref:hypothetical protein n=1 Tax=Sphingopyxis sp. Root1497 TaxID=1736474 RepID=UPI000A861176|nr:hypothetical protein [Sphingopyxis sp. Root1497]